MLGFETESTGLPGFGDFFPDVPRSFTRDNGLRGFDYWAAIYLFHMTREVCMCLGEDILYMEAMEYLNELP